MNFSLKVSDWKRIAWTAIFAFIAVYWPLATGWSKFQNFSEVKAATLALLPTAIAAVGSAIKNGILEDESKFK